MYRLFAIVFMSVPCLAVAQSEELLPAYLIQLPQSVTTVLVAETETSTLHRYGYGENGVDSYDTYYMSIGQRGVGKRRAWDRRTPLGIYFVNERLSTTGLHERYGPMAFPLDYPNAWDRVNERSGDGIWIHGVIANSDRRPPLDTDGCIALPNDALMSLEGMLQATITPVIIARHIDWASREDVATVRRELVAALDEWTQSFGSGELHRYLALYADDFEYRGMDRSEWVAYRVQTIASKAINDFSVDELLLLSDPEDEGLYLSRFRQTIVDDTNTIVTTKRLYWRRSVNGALRIVAEDNG